MGVSDDDNIGGDDEDEGAVSGIDAAADDDAEADTGDKY